VLVRSQPGRAPGVQSMKTLMKPGLWDTWVATVNQGLPNRLLGPDEALAKLEEARLKGR